MAKMLLKQYAEILYEVTKDRKDKELDAAIVSFFSFLKKRQMLKKIHLIIEEFKSYAKEKEGIDTIYITSAHPLSERTVDEIAKAFSSSYEVQSHVDESLLGGVKIRKKNILHDASIKTQLAHLKESLSK